LTVRTPEGVVFALPLAGPVSRFLGWSFDAVLVYLVMVGVLQVLILSVAVVGDWLGIFMFVFVLLVPALYGMLFEWFWRGQTPGKKIARLRVIDETGLRLTFRQIVVRNLLRAVDALPPVTLAVGEEVFSLGAVYIVGGLACVLTRQCQRLGDIAAGTVVIRLVDEEVPVVEGVMQGKFNSFRGHPHLEARLRQRVSPEEAQVALAALMRRDRIEAGSRLALYAELADHFRRLVAFPEAVTHGMTDEQYVRNVVDSVFRGRRPPARAQKAGRGEAAAAGAVAVEE
jgi:uncharacterized RDD family membrane protein YckC